MVRADPLAILIRLHRLQADAARRRLADAVAQVRLAGSRKEAAEASLPRQRQAAAALPSDFALWLPRGLAEHERAVRVLAQAEQQEDAARQALLAARAAEHAAATIVRQRQADRDRKADRKAQAALDEHGAARRPGVHDRGEGQDRTRRG